MYEMTLFNHGYKRLKQIQLSDYTSSLQYSRIHIFFIVETNSALFFSVPYFNIFRGQELLPIRAVDLDVREYLLSCVHRFPIFYRFLNHPVISHSYFN